MSETTTTRRRYTEDEIQRGLLQLALCAGNSHEASRRLSAQGLDIPDSRLRSWRLYDHPDRYQEACKRIAPQVEQAIIHDMRAVALEAIDGTREAVQLERQRLQTGETKDPAATARNLATVAGIATDKMLLIEGRPTTITQDKTADELLTRLQTLIPGFQTIDGTATEQPQPQPPTLPLQTEKDETNALELTAGEDA